MSLQSIRLSLNELFRLIHISIDMLPFHGFSSLNKNEQKWNTLSWHVLTLLSHALLLHRERRRRKQRNNEMVGELLEGKGRDSLGRRREGEEREWSLNRKGKAERGRGEGDWVGAPLTSQRGEAERDTEREEKIYWDCWQTLELLFDMGNWQRPLLLPK